MRELVPQLRYLDNVNIEEDAPTCCSATGEDWDILLNSFRKRDSSEAAGEYGLTFIIYTDQAFWTFLTEWASCVCICGRVQLCRTPFYLSCGCQASFSSKLQTHTDNRPWSSDPSWIQTWFFRIDSGNSKSRNQHPNTWLAIPQINQHTALIFSSFLK